MRFALSPVASVEGEQVLSLDAAKAHLRVLHDDEDDLISALRDAAIDAVQQYTGKSLTEVAHVWRGRFASRMTLGIGPLIAVQSIVYLDADGVSQTGLVATDTVRLGLGSEIEVKTGVTLPYSADGDGVVTVNFTAGYSNVTRPPALVQAVRLMLGNLYLNREAVVTGVAASELPLGFMMLCSPYREMRI